MTTLPRTASDALVFDEKAGIERLVEIMVRLRAPDGCPWDRVQDFRSIAPYTIEEACEVAEAIERGDMAGLKDELGDLLLQVVYHARMAEEADGFGFADVVRAICAKMLRRHPHVFGAESGGPRARPEDVDWEAMKAAERALSGKRRESVIDGVRAERTLAIIFDVAAQGNNIVSADRTLDLTPIVVSRLRSGGSQ